MKINDNEIFLEATDILKSLFGKDASFRQGQYEAIEATMTKSRTLIVQRTGWGKSLVYFSCTKMLRRQGKGVTLVVSPLLVLMENQLEQARTLNLRCDALSSETKDRHNEIIDSLKNNTLDLVLITPETLYGEKMQKELIYSERTEFACMADPAGSVRGIPSGRIYRRCSVAAEYI